MKFLRIWGRQGPVARGTLRTAFVLGGRLVVQAGTLLLVARMLGAEQFAAFAAAAAVAVVVGAFSNGGTHLVLLGEVSADARRRWDVLAYALPTTLLLGGVLLLAYLELCSYLLAGNGISLRVLVLLGGTEILLQPLILLGASEQHGLGHIARSQMLAILPLAVRLVIAAVIWWAAPALPLDAYAYGYAFASMVALLLVIHSLPVHWPEPGRWRWPRWGELRNATGFAVIGLTKTAPAELDKVMATRLLPLASAGVYAAAARVIAAITLPVTAMTTSALPRLFREGRTDGAQRLLRWMFLVATGYSIAVAAGVWLAAPLLKWVFGEQYHGIEEAVRWLCIAIPGMSVRLVAGNALMAVGKPWARAGFECFGAVVLVLASVVMVRQLGTIGMPLALACSEWGMAIVGVLLLGYPRFRTHGADCRPSR